MVTERPLPSSFNLHQINSRPKERAHRWVLVCFHEQLNCAAALLAFQNPAPRVPLAAHAVRLAPLAGRHPVGKQGTVCETAQAKAFSFSLLDV